MPIPDKLKIKMLHPPPIPKIIQEPLCERIKTNITYMDKRRYTILCKDQNISLAHALREGLKLFFNGDSMGTIQNMLSEFLNSASHYKTPSKYVRKAIGSEWEEARKKAKEGELIIAIPQTSDHKNFMDKCVPELKEAFLSENKGLMFLPKEVLIQGRPKTDVGSYIEWKKNKSLEAKA